MVANFISISGKAGSGKTTIANYLKNYFRQQNYTVNDFSFAGPIKDCCTLWFGWDRQRLDTDLAYKEGDRLDDGSPDPYCQRLKMTRRQVMQKFGTECMRNGMHPDFWIILASLGVQLGKIPHSDLYIIGDARFCNELEWAWSINAYRILVTRADVISGETLTAHTEHPSEIEFLCWDDFDETIMNVVDENLTTNQNKMKLYTHLDEVTIPATAQRFKLNVFESSCT